MRRVVAGWLAAALLLVAVPGTALAGRAGDAKAGGPAPAGHGDIWMF